jgi:ASC-1-like (ASCH) protein
MNIRPEVVEHELKTDPQTFDDVEAGLKTFEIRLDDRNFAVGDILVLRRTRHSGAAMAAGAPLEFTGRTLRVVVQHKLKGYGLMPGWCVLSIRHELLAPARPLPSIACA